MESRVLAQTDGDTLTVSRVGLGCNTFGRRIDFDQTRGVLHAALDAGITFFDTAANYGDGLSEEYLGEILGPRRKDVAIATKFSRTGGAGRDWILKSAENSLKALRTDYIDLYQIHFPDPETPIGETLEAMDSLVRAGKVRFIACSNFTGTRLEEAMQEASRLGTAKFVTAQNEYNVLRRGIESDLVPVCQRHGVGILPYRPMASGLLSGKYLRGAEPLPNTRLGDDGERGLARLRAANFDVLEALQSFADRSGHTMLDVALAWLLAQPAVPTIIPGATRPDQIQRNAAAAEWAPTSEDLAEIERIIAEA